MPAKRQRRGNTSTTMDNISRISAISPAHDDEEDEPQATPPRTKGLWGALARKIPPTKLPLGKAFCQTVGGRQHGTNCWKNNPRRNAKTSSPCQELPISKTGPCCLSASMISMMINSVSHNAPSRLTTTAETDQLTWFCTFLRVARMERSRQGPVCKHQRKRRTSIKRGNGSPAPPQQRNPSRLLRQKRNTRKRKKSTNALQHIWQIWQSQNCLYAKLGETTVK